jgi:hypothetical protein
MRTLRKGGVSAVAASLSGPSSFCIYHNLYFGWAAAVNLWRFGGGFWVFSMGVLSFLWLSSGPS